MYTFDSRLRSLLFSKIEKIEVAIRSALSNIVANETGDIFWVTNAANYTNLDQYNTLMTVINYESDRFIPQKEDCSAFRPTATGVHLMADGPQWTSQPLLPSQSSLE